MKPILLIALLVTARLSLAADTTVVKVLAHYADGTVSQGTGWFFNRHVLATDYHVVRNGVSFEVVYADGTVRGARLWTFNANCDLATLEIPEPRADQQYLAVVADSDKAYQNQPIKAISYPRGNRTISQGKLTHAYWSDSRRGSIVLFGSDLLTSYGGSGGPVLNSQGRVVGMLEAIAKDGEPEAFVISANVIWEALQMNGPAHPNGFVTGITKGVNLNQREGYLTP
jgi:S1-C subfamily serine protease